MADVEAWRRSLDPAVIDRWLVYARVEPETFAGDGWPAAAAGRQPEGHVHMVDAWEAYGMLSRKYGR